MLDQLPLDIVELIFKQLPQHTTYRITKNLYKKLNIKDIYDSPLDIMDMKDINFHHLYSYCSLETYKSVVDINKVYDYNIRIIIRKERLDILNYLRSKGFIFDSYHVREAIRWNNIVILDYFHNNGFPFPQDPHIHAAEHGHLEVIKYLMSIDYKLTPDTLLHSFKHDHIHIAKFLIDNGIICDEYLMCKAVENNSLKIVELFLKRGIMFDDIRVIKTLQMAKLLYAHGFKFKENHLLNAASSGRIILLIYYHRHLKMKFPIEVSRSISYTNKENYTELIKYLIKIRAPIDKNVLQKAALTYNAELVRRLYHYNPSLYHESRKIAIINKDWRLLGALTKTFKTFTQ